MATGGVLSRIVNETGQELMFPHSSVATYVTVCTPTGTLSNMPPLPFTMPNGVNTFTCQLEQTSDTVAGGKLSDAEQPPDAASCTIGAGQTNDGGVLSSTLMTWMQVNGLGVFGLVGRHQS